MTDKSSACGATGERKECLKCGKLFEQGDRLLFNFLKAKYCGRVCYRAAQKFTPEQAIASFWAKVDKGGECWLWTGYKQPDGYGQYRVWRKFYNSHKYSYELANGPIPAGLEVMHSCHVRHCVNPAHMRLGTHQENVAESVALDRHSRGERNKKNKLTEKDVLVIRQEYKPGKNAAELAKRYGVSTAAISAACNGRSWTHLK